MTDVLQDLSRRLEQFAAERDWGRFHSPKNLASALIVEAAELLEHFQWKTEAESRELSSEQREAVAAEMADVFLYLLHLGKQLGIDLAEAANAKMQVNERRFPKVPQAE